MSTADDLLYDDFPLPPDADLGRLPSLMVRLGFRGLPTIKPIVAAGGLELLENIMESMWVEPGVRLRDDVEEVAHAAGVDPLTWLEKWARVFERAFLRVGGFLYIKEWIPDLLRSWRAIQERGEQTAPARAARAAKRAAAADHADDAQNASVGRVGLSPSSAPSEAPPREGLARPAESGAAPCGARGPSDPDPAGADCAALLVAEWPHKLPEAYRDKLERAAMVWFRKAAKDVPGGEPALLAIFRAQREKILGWGRGRPTLKRWLLEGGWRAKAAPDSGKAAPAAKAAGSAPAAAPAAAPANDTPEALMAHYRPKLEKVRAQQGVPFDTVLSNIRDRIIRTFFEAPGHREIVLPLLVEEFAPERVKL